jgi:hypothetical protein
MVKPDAAPVRIVGGLGDMEKRCHMYVHAVSTRHELCVLPSRISTNYHTLWTSHLEWIVWDIIDCVCLEGVEKGRGRGEVDRNTSDWCALARFSQSPHTSSLVSD